MYFKYKLSQSHKVIYIGTCIIKDPYFLYITCMHILAIESTQRLGMKAVILHTFTGDRWNFYSMFTILQ